MLGQIVFHGGNVAGLSHVQGKPQFGDVFTNLASEKSLKSSFEDIVVCCGHVEVGESVQVESHFDGTQGGELSGQFNGNSAGALHLTLKRDDSFRIDIDLQVDLFNGQCADTFGQNADFFNGGKGSDKMYPHQILIDLPAEINIFGVSYGQGCVSFFFRDFIDSLGREVGDFDDRQIHGNGKVAGGLFHGTSYLKRLGVVGVANQIDGGLCHLSGVQFTFNFDVSQCVVKFVFHLDGHGADSGTIAHE